MNIHFLTPGEHKQLCDIAKQHSTNFFVECGLVVDSFDNAFEYMEDLDIDKAFLTFHDNMYYLTCLPDYFIQCETHAHAQEVQSFIDELVATH